MHLRLGEHVIDCTHRTAVMGILNVSDDSPIRESIRPSAAGVERGLELWRQGAEIVDVGANSTATHSRALTAQEEIERVCPVIEGLVREGVPASIDTWTPEVARAAAAAGVHLLNDVTGFVEPAMVAVAAEFGLPGCVMHMRGEPKRHREADQRYEDIATEVRDVLLERARAIEAAGAPRPWLDPGFAFGKSADDNVRLLDGLGLLLDTGYPVLISASRKGFLAELLGAGDRQDVDGLLEATLAFNVIAAWRGVHVVRVHDVPEMLTALRVVNEARRRLAGEA